jgi:hypothetical protein
MGHNTEKSMSYESQAFPEMWEHPYSFFNSNALNHISGNAPSACSSTSNPTSRERPAALFLEVGFSTDDRGDDEMSKSRKRTKKYQGSPYLAALRAVVPTPGTVQRIEIQHDSWCDLLNGRGYCNCNPVVCAPEIVDMITRGNS